MIRHMYSNGMISAWGAYLALHRYSHNVTLDIMHLGSRGISMRSNRSHFGYATSRLSRMGTYDETEAEYLTRKWISSRRRRSVSEFGSCWSARVIFTTEGHNNVQGLYKRLSALSSEAAVDRDLKDKNIW